MSKETSVAHIVESGPIENAGRMLNDNALSAMSDFATAMRIMEETGLVAESMSDYGTGFIVVGKERLVGVPFVAVEWRFNEGDYKDENGQPMQFVSVACVTKNNDKFVINDGGTGICSQLADVTRRRQSKGHPNPQNALLVPAGLTESNYTFVDAKGVEQPATTYYLSESPAL